MPKYIIERDIPGASNFTPYQLQEMARKSLEVINKMGAQIRWQHSYVTDDKVYSVYIAPNKDWIQEHSRKAGFPANVITVVSIVIDPATAEESLVKAKPDLV